MKSSLAKNALANVAQMLLSALILFFLYRYISQSLGVAKLGIWSVVLATASASRLADLGLGVGVTRFVAQNLAQNKSATASAVVETATITIALILGLGLVIFYPVFKSVLQNIFIGIELDTAIDILPFALLSLWLAMVGSIVQSGLDGCQKMVGRAILGVLSQFVLIVFVLVWVPDYELKGLAYAQIAQGVFLLLTTWLYLRSDLKELSLIPYVWSSRVFKTMLSYGANVQLASLSILLFEPLTKAFMAKFGGAEAAGWYEIANQLVIKIRALMVAANQAIVPKVTQLNEINAAELGQIYKENIKVLMLFAIPIHAMMMAGAGLFSFVLLGGLNESFIAILHIVILAWLVNAFTFPAYFIGLGIGQVGLNTVAHFVIGIINLVLGYVLGDMYGVFGVVAASAIALCVGSLMLILVFQRVNKIVINAIFSYEFGLIIIASLALSMAGFVWPIFGSGGMVDKWALFMQLILVVSLVVLIIRSQFIKTLLNSTFRKEKK